MEPAPHTGFYIIQGVKQTALYTCVYRAARTDGVVYQGPDR